MSWSIPERKCFVQHHDRITFQVRQTMRTKYAVIHGKRSNTSIAYREDTRVHTASPAQLLDPDLMMGYSDIIVYLRLSLPRVTYRLSVMRSIGCLFSRPHDRETDAAISRASLKKDRFKCRQG